MLRIFARAGWVLVRRKLDTLRREQRKKLSEYRSAFHIYPAFTRPADLEFVVIDVDLQLFFIEFDLFGLRVEGLFFIPLELLFAVIVTDPGNAG